MSKLIYWFDDAFDDQALPNELECDEIKEVLDAEIVPSERIKSREQFLELVESINPDETMGVVMDYQLRRVESGGGDTKGSVWAAEIRFKHPSVPVVGISHEDENRIPDFQLESFLAFFPRQQLSEPEPEYLNLGALFTGYAMVYEKYIKSSPNEGINNLVALTEPPDEVAKTLSDSIPSKLRSDWDQETPHIASRWIWHELQGRPGFLLDSLEAATVLGLNRLGFESVESSFSEALYGGAFASDQRRRWWASRMRGVVKSIIGEDLPGPVSHHRERLLDALSISGIEREGMLSQGFAVAEGVGGIPNCVAFPDDETRDMEMRVQTFHDSTVVLDVDAGQPFGFEPRRTFRAI